MQSSNFDATAFQNSIYGNPSSFESGPFKVSHTGYSPDSSSDASSFYQSYISPPTSYPQGMPGYGCRDPPSYVETSFFRHPSPNFMQNFGGGVNYYKMASSRQMDMSDYSTPSLMTMTSSLKQGEPFSYNSLQLENSFSSDTHIPSTGGSVNPSGAIALPHTELSASLIGQNQFQHHHHHHHHPLHNAHQSQQHQSDPQEPKPTLVQTELHQDTYSGSSAVTDLYGTVKLEGSGHPNPSVSSYSKESFDSNVHSLSQSVDIPVTVPNCPDVKPTVSSKTNIPPKSQSLFSKPAAESQQNTIAKRESFNNSTQPGLPQTFKNPPENSQSSLSKSQENAPSSTKDELGEISNNGSPTDPQKPPSSEETGEAKPTMSYIALIAKAILESDQRRLNLGSIYHWIEKHYPFYKNKGQGWRNSVRHNLSLNDCFIKVRTVLETYKGLDTTD